MAGDRSELAARGVSACQGAHNVPALLHRISNVKDLTQGSIVSHVVTMAAPIFVGIIMTMLCQVIDLFFVADLGDAAIAGVGAAGNTGFLINAFTQVLSVSTVALVSHAVGRRDQVDANLVFNQALGLSILCGIGAMLAGFALARGYMRSLAADEATVKAGTIYLIWFMPALSLQFPMLVMAAALRGTGIVQPAMMIQALTVLLNIALAPMLIAGWGTGYPLGVAGAGLASSLAVAVGVVMLWAYLQWSRHYLILDRRYWRPQLPQWKRIVGVGLPAGGELAIIFLYMAAIYYALRDLGAAAQAGFGIGTRVLGLIQVPALAIAFAAGPIVGQNFGAGDSMRVRETFKQVLLLAIAIMLGATVLVQWKPELLMKAFTADRDTIAVGAGFLKLVSLNLVAQALIFVCSSVFQGLGHTTPQLISSIARLITYVIPLLWLSAQSGFRTEQIWYLSIATTTLQALLSLWLLRLEFGKRLAPMVP
jgi:putative MATE family efflux protein